ncbi:MAG: hydrogenase maturation protease [Phycisphaeraceae bacterium]|nr:hydrogenase maturation protease [Phycisphaeraceae bacterium]
MAPPHILVASCGNPDAGADAFGPAVTAALRQKRGQTPFFKVIDLGIRPAALLDHLEGVDELIIVDAALLPGRKPLPGVLDIDWDSPARPPLAHDDPMSTHGLSIAHQLELARALGLLPPRVRLIAALINSPAAFQPGQTLDPKLAALVDEAVRRIADV